MVTKLELDEMVRRITCECSADPSRSAEECQAWNAEHNPGTVWALSPCDCDCHWSIEQWHEIDPDHLYHSCPKQCSECGTAHEREDSDLCSSCVFADLDV